MTIAKNYDIFISYSHKDASAVLSLMELFKAKDLKVWVDLDRLKVGTSAWTKAIERALEQTYCLIAILSPDAKESVWVSRELAYAEQHLVKIFPVLVRGNAQESVPISLSLHQRLDISDQQSFEVNVPTLIANLESYLEAARQVIQCLKKIDFDDSFNVNQSAFEQAREASKSYQELINIIETKEQDWKQYQQDQQLRDQTAASKVEAYLMQPTDTLSWVRADNLLRLAEEAAMGRPELISKVQSKRSTTFQFHQEIAEQALKEAVSLALSEDADIKEIFEKISAAKFHGADTASIDKTQKDIEKILAARNTPRQIAIQNLGNETVVDHVSQAIAGQFGEEIFPQPTPSIIHPEESNRLSSRNFPRGKWVKIVLALLVIITIISGLLSVKTPSFADTATPNSTELRGTFDTRLSQSTPTSTATPTQTLNRADIRLTLDAVQSENVLTQTAQVPTKDASVTVMPAN